MLAILNSNTFVLVTMYKVKNISRHFFLILKMIKNNYEKLFIKIDS